MAAPTFVGAGTAVIIQTGGAAVTAAGSGVAVGDLVVLQVLQDGTAASAVTYSAISGVANLAGTASSLTVLATDQPCGTLAKQHLRVGRATSTTVTVTATTTGDDLYCCIYAFRGVASGANLSDILENGTAGSIVNGSGATAAITDTGVVTLGADRLALQFVGVDDDNPLDPFTGMTGGIWFEATPDFASATGTDAAIQLQLGYGLDLDYRTTSGSTNFGNTVVQTKLAQSFLAPRTETVNVFLGIGGAVAVAADDVTVRIETDAGGSPSGTLVGTQVNLDVVFGTSFAGAVPVQASVTAATKYWIVVGRTGALSAAAYYGWNGSLTNYTGQDAQVFDGSSWSSDTTKDTRRFALLPPIPSGGTIDGGSQTMAAADNWGVIGFALKPAASGPATVTRTAALNASGLVATVGRKEAQRTTAVVAVGAVASAAVFWTTFERQVAANATGLIATAGVRQSPATQRSAALTATGLIATVGRELLPRTAALAATGLVATSGVVVHVRSRQAALTATGLIATAGRELLPRQAALNATGLIASSGVKVGAAATVERSAALTATGLIASSGRELLPRLSRVDATGLISAVGQRRLHRQTVLGATATIAANGMIEGGIATVERSAALTATGSIATVRLRVHVRQAILAGTGTVAVAYQRRHHRAAAFTAAGTVTVGFSRSWSSSAALNATGAVVATPQRLLLRSAALNATGDIELIAGGNTAQFSFEAIGTITVVVPWYAGAISTPTTGYIYGAYLGAIQGGSQGRIATGTDGQLAKTGG